MSDVTSGIRVAPPPGPTPGLKESVDLPDGSLSSDAADGSGSALESFVSPVHSSIPPGGKDEAASFAASVKEKLLSSSSRKPSSTKSTPTGSRSPAGQPSTPPPPHSVTPDPRRHYSQSKEQNKAGAGKLVRRSASPVKSPQEHSTISSSSGKKPSTNPFDSHSSGESSPSSSSHVGNDQKKLKRVETNQEGGSEKDQFAVANAVALSKASVKFNESDNDKEPPLSEQEKDMVALATAVAVSNVSSQLSRSGGSVTASDKKTSPIVKEKEHAPERRDSGKRKPSASKPLKVVQKPRLDSLYLGNFFSGIVAQDKGEVMMNVMWGGCNVVSSPMCEIEVGIITSDRAIYVLEVLDPEKHVKRQLSWTSENLPLAKIMSIPISTLSKVNLGILDQVISAEFISKGVVKRFTFVPYSADDVRTFVDTLKAVLEAGGIKYVVSSQQELILSPPNADDDVIFLNPDTSDFTKLKESIVQPKTVVQVGNYIASSSNDKNIANVSIDEETRRVTDDICSKFEVEQYFMVAQVSSDYLPIANDKLHLRSRVLILTNDTIYLCKEDFCLHPNDTSRSFNPPFPRCIVLDSHPIVCATDILIREVPQSVVPYTDPVFEFSVSFEVVNNVPSSAKTSFEWRLCSQKKERILQFVESLSKQIEMSELKGLRVTRTVDSISPLLRSTEANQPTKKKSSSKLSASTKPSGGSSNKLSPVQPSFFHSEMLVNFARLTNFRRLKFFKKHIAQAEFMKSDEVPLSVFLSHCSTSDRDDATEVEACVLTSNYAIYLLSDLDNVQAWVDGGGPISFQRRALTSKKDTAHLRCFYRLWLTDIKEIRVGLFYLSVFITYSAKSNPCTFVIHTNIPSATLSLLSALSVSVNLRDSAEEEELSDLLSDYIDLAAESISKQTKPLTRPNVEFVQQHDLDVDKLKQMLLGIGPKISRSRSIEESAATMQIFCQQIMLLVEEIRIRDSVCLKSNPHLVLLTNYGLFVCKNSNFDQQSPSVASPSDLQVRKWCHTDLIESVKVANSSSSIYGEHMLTILVRSQDNMMERNTLRLLVQNSELLNHFLHFLCHVWQVRSSRQLPIEWE